jgi:hypothetical protein
VPAVYTAGDFRSYKSALRCSPSARSALARAYSDTLRTPEQHGHEMAKARGVTLGRVDGPTSNLSHSHRYVSSMTSEDLEGPAALADRDESGFRRRLGLPASHCEWEPHVRRR